MAELTKIHLPVEAIREYCEAQPIARLSELTPEFDGWLRPDTDIGLLVEYLPDSSITYIDMARQERELGAMIGRAVDLRTPNELSQHFRQKFLESAILVFAKNSS